MISIATGRIVEIGARLGDTVKKGQTVAARAECGHRQRLSPTIRKLVADEELTRTQLERAQLFYDKGAISLNDLQIARDTDTKAKVDVKTAAEKLRVLGSPNLDQPTGIVDIRAPISGVITDQQVTNAAGVASGWALPNPFTISDLGSVWILCDVSEKSDLSTVHLGEKADIVLKAYPDKVFTGDDQQSWSGLRIRNIRTAKVRIEVRNPRTHAVGHVCHGHVSRSEERDARSSPGDSNIASS